VNAFEKRHSDVLGRLLATVEGGRGDPFSCLPRREQRRWRRAERRALREHEAWQLATLRNLAAADGRLVAVTFQRHGTDAAAAEFVIGGKRVRAAPVHLPTLSALTQAIAAVPAIPLLAASRYGTYWVLTFDLTAGPLVVLAGRLSILSSSPPPAQAGPPQLPPRPAAGAEPLLPVATR
jgi:hypothetical protein